MFSRAFLRRACFVISGGGSMPNHCCQRCAGTLSNCSIFASISTVTRRRIVVKEIFLYFSFARSFFAIALQLLSLRFLMLISPMSFASELLRKLDSSFEPYLTRRREELSTKQPSNK